MTPDYTPTEQETTAEKIRLIDLVRPELKEHGLVDLTAFVNRESKDGFKHSGFVRSLAYRIEEKGIAKVIPQKEWTEFYIKRNIYSKRHPILFGIILAAFGVIFSIIAGSVNAIISHCITKGQQKKELRKILSPIEQRQEGLSDIVATIRHDLKAVQDTLAKYKQR
jgi:hypothetical protein